MMNDPGRMRYKLTIQELMVTPDEKEEQIEIWNDMLTVHCAVSQFTGTEKFQARQEITESDVTFTIRWSKNLSHINEQDFRIFFKGEVYDILFINDPGLMHEKLIISAKKRV
ncbi:MAG: phage head closure protein [Ruminococcus sp.]|nr:phage head closure protein [Ruminococcus sp.]